MRRISRDFAVVVVLLAGMVSTVLADGLSRTDKLRVLYSNQFAFDRRGVPIITIGIKEGIKEVVIEAASPLRVLPDGEDGSEVLGGNRWRVALKRSKPATISYYVVLAREATSALTRLQKKLKRWQKMGARCRVLETGTLFGVRGKVFDNRAYVLAEGPFSTDRAARARAERHLKAGKLKKVGVISQLEKRPSGRMTASFGDTKIKVRDAIWFASADRRALHVRVGNGPARAYWGQLYVTIDKRGKLAVVNAVPADRLLAGLVPAEIFPSAPTAALRAQAVAARGDLLAKIGSRHHVDPYLICAKQHCQVYRGAGFEHPRTTAAVSATKGLVLVRKDGSLVKTVYSASCGGHSEHNDEVWPVESDYNLRGHIDGPPQLAAKYRRGITKDNIRRWLTTRPRGWCGSSTYNRDKFRWTKRVSAVTLSRSLRSLGIGPLRSIRVLARGVSGRATLLEVAGALRKTTIRGELRIRRMLGGLRSSMFIVTRLASSSGVVFEFRGGGWGHGVGMCQTGATAMAQASRNFRQILSHYYLRSDLQPLY